MLREAEVFGVNHKFAVNAKDYDINNPLRHQLLSSHSSSGLINTGYQPTVPMPFNLSNNAQFGHIKKNKINMEIKHKELSDLTFKPRIND